MKTLLQQSLVTFGNIALKKPRFLGKKSDGKGLRENKPWPINIDLILTRLKILKSLA